MSVLNYLEHVFSSVVGSGLSLAAGQGLDQNESYYRPNQDAAPEIHIHTDQVSVSQSLDVASSERAAQERAADAALQADRGFAPLPERAQDINSREWDIGPTPHPAAPQHDAAFYAALAEHMQREQDLEQGLRR